MKSSLATTGPAIIIALLSLGLAPIGGQESAPARTMAEVLAASSPSDWRPLDPSRTLVLEIERGRVVIELAAALAPRHIENLETLLAQKYFDGLAITRVQENYVVQWGDPEAENPETRRSSGRAQATLELETDRASSGLEVTLLPDGDVYAPRVGFVDGFPVALDETGESLWLAHCYGMVGVGRADPLDSGNGTEMYVVIGHAPRHLDRNVTLVGRVLEGMELLTTLPRGTGPLGFYETATERVPIESARLGDDLPVEQRARLEVLRTDTATFTALIESRRYRRESWFAQPGGHIELCNVPLPVREAP